MTTLTEEVQRLKDKLEQSVAAVDEWKLRYRNEIEIDRMVTSNNNYQSKTDDTTGERYRCNNEL